MLCFVRIIPDIVTTESQRVEVMIVSDHQYYYRSIIIITIIIIIVKIIDNIDSHDDQVREGEEFQLHCDVMPGINAKRMWMKVMVMTMMVMMMMMMMVIVMPGIIAKRMWMKVVKRQKKYKIQKTSTPKGCG